MHRGIMGRRVHTHVQLVVLSVLRLVHQGRRIGTRVRIRDAHPRGVPPEKQGDEQDDK